MHGTAVLARLEALAKLMGEVLPGNTIPFGLVASS
jgi:hypothetical protein